ncbi:restriction endonuclease subunit S [Corynebacterium sp. P7202]|uniref:Restriction endonuclease subunit S n=1 Tax=Corynebacterium pygosceleis TaxID=2800406 RepID=A0A9Q4C9G8_9CORY|nr:restriction endonuclease subunit S [Corynebacterium pygosceleis]MCK7638065.1 restriction endonuclease subunit S [Corynebacterium pygosceleis]MCX7468781.1 restriction endonuclease subunit S [Corynebacterium pygosceleis]
MSSQLREAGGLGTFLGGSGFPVRYQGAKYGDLPFFKVSDMNSHGNELFMTRANNYISESLRKKLGVVRIPAKAIVFAKVGAAVFRERKRILLQDSCVDNNMAAFIVNEDQLDFRFAYYALTAFKMSNLVSVGALPSLNGGQLRSILLFVPTDLTEQRRIADALFDIDNLIATLERLIAKREAIKQGMMQQLLTGRTRLPGFRSVWKGATLGAVASVTMGQSPAGSTYNSDAHGLPLIQGNADIRDRVTLDRIWTDLPTKVCEAGDILLTVRAPVGYTAIVSKRSCVGRGVCSISSYGDNRFIFYALVYAEPTWSNYGQGSTFTAVNSGEVRSFKLLWPTDAEERQSIARVLDDFNSQIAALRTRLSKTRAIKQGMMQQLLTGRVRLPTEEAS